MVIIYKIQFDEIAKENHNNKISLNIEKIRLSLDHDLKIVLYVMILIENHILAPLEYLINDISQ